jgi:hypothetical protein
MKTKTENQPGCLGFGGFAIFFDDAAPSLR